MKLRQKTDSSSKEPETYVALMMEYNNVQCLSANKLRDVHWEGSGGWVCERECVEVRDTMSAYACICTHLKHGTTGRDADLNLTNRSRLGCEQRQRY